MTTDDAQVIGTDPILANDTLKNMLKSMHVFAANTEKLARTVQVIREIAFQNSIFALGTTLEAARGVEFVGTINAGMAIEEIALPVLVGCRAPATPGNRVTIG